MKRPSFLMCRPTFYGVSYKINPWMQLRCQPNPAQALREWAALRRTLESELGADVRLCRARPGWPDMAFTANAGLVHGRAFIPSRFRHRERAGEEPYFTNWFRARGYRILPLAGDVRFEGAGDALFLGKNLIAGYHFRSDFQTHEEIGRLLNLRVLSLELVNERFYHLDTCFLPLDANSAIYYPQAFDRYGDRLLRQSVGDLIRVSKEEAYQFGCNAVVVGKRAVISNSCTGLARALRRRGYTVYPLDLAEFLKAGGAAKCLTLRLE